jgi:hypothetical protein
MTPITRKPSAAAFAATCALAWMTLGCFHSAAAQSASNGGNLPPSPSTTDTKADKPASQAPQKPAEPAATAEPAKKSRVITNEDFKSGRFSGHDGLGSSRDIPGVGECDDDCADEARATTDFGPDQDGDWAFALTTARRNLAQDAAWPGAIATLARAVKTYCTFQNQVQATAVPSGNDYNSRVERARAQNYVDEMERALGQNVTNANARIDQMADRIEDDEPARAAIMRVLARRVNDSCDP